MADMDQAVVVGSYGSLHGRHRILTNETEITDGNVLTVLTEALRVHAANRADILYLEKYLRGIQPILHRVKQYNGEINNKVVVNIANEIVTFKKAEFCGEPIQYVSRGTNESVPELLDKLNAMMISEGKQSKDMKLAGHMFTCGVAYRLVLNDKSRRYASGDLYDEAPFEVYTPEPSTTFIVRVNDVTERPIMGVTYVYLAPDKVRYTVYTDNVTYTIDGGPLIADKIVGKTVHNFGAITLIEYPCNDVYMGAFEVVLDLLNAISQIESNRVDGIEQFIQAIMVFEGVDVSKEQLTELKQLGALKLPPNSNGTTGKVYYLNEELNQGQTQTLVDDLYQIVLQIVGMPSQGNANTSDSSNNGAVILKNGWWSAEARALETEGVWKASETEFLKVVLKICEQSNALSGLSLSDIEPKFGRRSYQDLLTKTQSFTTLLGAGCPPIQAYTISGVVNDPEAASIQYAAYQEQQEQAMETELMKERANARTSAVRTERPDDSGAE